MKITKLILNLFAIATLLTIFSCKKDDSNTELNTEDDLLYTTGYYLFSPMGNKNVYLIDELGEVAHQWETGYTPALSVYLLDDGTLLRTESKKSTFFNAGGAGGRVAMYDATANEIWSYEYADSEKLLHHDIEMLPNGNILMIAWEKYTVAEAILQGLNTTEFNENEIWGDHIIPIKH